MGTLTIRGSVVLASVAALVVGALWAPAPEQAGLPPEPMVTEWMSDQRGRPGDPTAFRQAVAQAESVRAASAGSPYATASWHLVGPTNIGGRVVDIAVDPIVPNSVFVAAATGGVWRSDNAGITFRSVWPDGQSQSLGALAAAPDGTLYAGTGEANPGGGSLTYGGTGVYRSTDRGETWTNVGLTDVSRIGRIAVSPSQPQVVFVAASGNLFTPGGPRGLYRSRNGGQTWSKVLAGANPTTGAIDVAIDPMNPAHVYAAMWDHRREPDLRRYGGVGSGVFRSTDGGNTWSRLGGGLPGVSGEVGRIGVAVRAGIVYSIVMHQHGYPIGFFASVDGGKRWVRSPADLVLSLAVGDAGAWFGRVWVDPLNPAHVFVGGVRLAESFDAGMTWTIQASSAANTPVHVDHHAIAWDPSVPVRAYLGNDGGVFRSDASGYAGTWVEAIYQPFAQFYSVDVGEQDPTRVVGGTQDQGSLRSYGGVDAPPATDGWNEFYGGDGEKTLISYRDQNLVYACYQFGNCARSTNGGQTMATMRGFSNRWNWFTPMEFDPQDPSVMYMAGDIVNKSFDGGTTWFPISNSLSTHRSRDSYPFGTVTTLAPATEQTGVIYAGTDDGYVWLHDPDQGWRKALDPDLPNRWVSRVAVDPTNPQEAYVTFSGFRAGDQGAHVFRTTDGGTDWVDISRNLPNAPVNDVVIVGDLFFVATDVGVFTAPRGAKPTWVSVGGAGLPLTPVTDIRHHAPTNRLFAATYGRGIYLIDLP